MQGNGECKVREFSWEKYPTMNGCQRLSWEQVKEDGLVLVDDSVISYGLYENLYEWCTMGLEKAYEEMWE